jgi:capsular polysaccharide transport system permease protein
VSNSVSVPASGLGRFFHDMREGARRQGNVVFALIFRQLKNKSSDGYGMLSLVGVILEPAIGVAATAAFWYTMRRQEIQGVNVLIFLTVSLTLFAIVRRSLSSIPRAVRSGRAFFAFPNVKPIDAIIAQFLLELILTIVGGALLLFLEWWFLDLAIDMSHFIATFLIFMLLVAAGFGISLFLGAYGTIYPFFATVLSMFSRVLVFVSAVIHPATELPAQAQVFLSYNPIAHAMEIARWYTLGIHPFEAASLQYVAAFAAISLFLGFIAYYPNRRRVLER